MESEFVTLEDIATYFVASKYTVRSWLWRGDGQRGEVRFPAGARLQVARAGNRWLARRADVESLGRALFGGLPAAAAQALPQTPRRRGRPRRADMGGAAG